MRLYSDLFEIPTENESIFESDRKSNLNLVEKLGLEAILADFIKDYEEETLGEFCAKDIKNYIRYNENGVDILDGITDTYIFDHYAIGEIWMTNNGCILMSAVDLDRYTGDEPERFEDSDIYERPTMFDIWSDFEPVLFRLD